MTRFPPLLVAALAFPIAGGLLSLALGQDANWDLRNYHRYAPWAMADRLGLDLAPVGLPSYANPLVDVPYAVLADRLPPRVLAFLMGAWQALAGVLLLRIGRTLLPTAGNGILLALAGVACLGGAFLAEFGSTMGDDTTAVLMLAAFAIVLDGIDRSPARGRLLVAGLVAGATVGLKLTNAPYALALAVAVLATGPGASRDRARACTWLAVGMTLGFLVTYGAWGLALWRAFGNPFFPMFNRLFEAPLAEAALMVDRRWMPKGVLEAVLFPWSFTAFPMRIHEIPIVNPWWPVVHGLMLVALGAMALGRWRAGDAPALRFLVAATATGLAAWMAVFSVGRYLIVLDLLLPLLGWALLHRFLGRRIAPWIAGALALLTVAAPFVRYDSWGRAPFAEVVWQVDVPPIADPGRTTVLVASAPMGWLLPGFPEEVAFVGLNGSFPASAAHRARVAAIVASRGGPVHALLPPAAADPGGLDRLNGTLARGSFVATDLACLAARAIIAQAPASDVVPDRNTADCRFQRDPTRQSTATRDGRAIAEAAAREGYAIDLDRCTEHAAAIGSRSFGYRFCPVTVVPTR